MKTYDSFIFSSYSYDLNTRRIELRYSLDDEIRFTETIEIPTDVALRANSQKLEAALFALHLIGGISYYKTCLPKRIEIRSGSLSEGQARFWNTVYEKGLGEFFYQNDIDFKGLINFPTTNNPITNNHPPPKKPTNKRVLVPIGGGKDSLVTIEKLRAEGKDITLFRMGEHPLIDALVEKIGLPCITVQRQLPRTLFEMNEQGALNGHIPITAYLSLLCVVVSELFGFDEIAMSNEASASEGNVSFKGMEINHQWSKSAEAEKLIADYVTANIDPNLIYKSELRELTELQIAERFSNYPQYFPITTSCNRNWKNNSQLSTLNSQLRWCNHCPKCAFVFCLMAAYLDRSTVTEMFGSCLYEDEKLIPLYKQLLGQEGFKPFECVGTPQETQEAFDLAHTRGDLDDTPVMQMFLKNRA